MVGRPAAPGAAAAAARQASAPAVTSVRDLLPFADGPPRLVFPIDGDVRFAASFGAPRAGGTRSHAGEDLFAPKGTPVVAVARGEVAWIHDGPRCCAVAVDHAGGWQSRYIHLDNDSPGTDDGKARGIAPGLAVGSPVRQGQLLGWVGDSGNAERTPPHLHFELREPSGEAMNVYARLVAAAAARAPERLAELAR